MSEWPFVARSEEFRVALGALETHSGHNGVILRGEGGVGKTTLAHLLAERLVADGWKKRTVLGTKTGRAVPLGAFNPVVFIEDAREPAVMLSVAYRELAAGEKTLLVVDDAQYLDPLSALLVSQLAMGGRLRLIVTCRSGEPVHDAIAALWKEDLLLRVDLEPFSRSETAELVSSVVDGEVDDLAVDRLQHLSSGSPLILRGLVTAALSDGALTQRDGRWAMNSEFHFDPDLTEVVESQLNTLTPAQREVAEIVATGSLSVSSAATSRCLESVTTVPSGFSSPGTRGACPSRSPYPLCTSVGETRANSPRFAAVTVRMGSESECTRTPP